MTCVISFFSHNLSLQQKQHCILEMTKFQWFMRVFVFFAFVLVVFSLIRRLEWNDDQSIIEFNSQKLTKCIETLKNLRLANAKLFTELENLNNKYCYILPVTTITCLTTQVLKISLRISIVCILNLL